MRIIEVQLEIGEMTSVEEAIKMAEFGLSRLKTEGSWETKLTFTPSNMSDEDNWKWDVLLEATWIPPMTEPEKELGEMVIEKPATLAQQWQDKT